MAGGSRKLKPESSPAASPASDDGAEADAQTRQRPRRLGSRSAANRATELRSGLASPLPAHREALLTATARLLTHLTNLSNLIYWPGDLKQDGEPRAALKTLLDYHERVTESLQELFGEDGDGGDLSSLFQRGKR